jgi:putative thiamine transport system permease protein
MLSVPHAAFAIGLVALLTPGGWLLRAFSPWATGFNAPPQWVTTQDPWGLGLIAVLTFKETPFLLWVAAMHLQQTDVTDRLRKEVALAQTMGYNARQAWKRVVWPQLSKHLRWPTLAVMAYGLSVVDVAMVIGPTSPPTLALLTWQWLQDSDPASNALGAAAAWMLLGLTGLCALLLEGTQRWPHWRKQWTQGADFSHARFQPVRNAFMMAALPLVYGAILCALALGSVVGVWPFPALMPQSWTPAAWLSVWESRAVLTTTAWLACASAGTAMVWSVVWLEWAPPLWQRNASPLIYVPLGLPAVLWVLGMHRLAISWNSDASTQGLWLVHTLVCTPYVMLAVQEPYRHFNPRMQAVAASLGKSRMAFLWQVKWPLLKATLASGFAVGFAVSVAQYLPTLYVGAGRFSTVTTEAVSLAAGGQRSLASAFAWLQCLLPALAFAAAGALGRPLRLG